MSAIASASVQNYNHMLLSKGKSINNFYYNLIQLLLILFIISIISFVYFDNYVCFFFILFYFELLTWAIHCPDIRGLRGFFRLNKK